MGRIGAVVVLLGLSAPFPLGAQVLEKVCVGPERSDRGRALALDVDAASRAHVLHVNDNGGGLYYTVVDAIDGDENMVVDRRASVLGGGVLINTDLRLFDGVPHICYRDAPSNTFRVGWLAGDEWVLEDVDQGAGYGDACALYRADGQLSVLYRRTNRLSVATRDGVDQWQIDDVDNIGSVGHDVQLTELDNGFIVAAHRDDTTGQLRVSWRDPQGRWRNETALWHNPAGLRPRIVPSGDTEVRIFHGIQNVNSDGGLLMTLGAFGALESSLLIQGEAGGSTAAALMSGRNLLLVTRDKRRNAVFGDFDGLRIFRDMPANANSEYLEQWDANAERHTLEFLDMAPDPFGMPVVALRDGPASEAARLCFWRAADRDMDRLPDMVEAWAETDPDNPDTDGDGRMDGDEAMAGDNPAGEGPIRPGLLLGDGEPPPPRPDMGLPPMPPMDAGLALDAAVQPQDASVSPVDAAQIEAGAVDAAQSEDAAPADASQGEDGSPVDMSSPLEDADGPAPDVMTPQPTDADRGDATGTSAPNPSTTDDDGGCSATGPTPSGWPLLLLILVGLRRRRRSM